MFMIFIAKFFILSLKLQTDQILWKKTLEPTPLQPKRHLIMNSDPILHVSTDVTLSL